MIVVESARPGFSYKTSQDSPSHPQPHDFPNEQLYHAYIVIQRFKNTITCDPRNITSTWTGHDICGERTYIGFQCARQMGGGDNLTVTSAIFNSFGLCAPKLQGFVDQLPDLALFQTTSNNFGGGFPSQLANLNEAYNDDVLVGRPAQFSESKDSRYGGPRLSDVSVNGFGLKGRTPDLLFTATHPNGVSITPQFPKNNPLSPNTKKLGLPNMSYLALANNKLTGPIPPSIAEAQDTLLEVLLLNNQLSGCLPHEIGMLHKAAVIDAGMNQLTGSIPTTTE